MKYADKKDIELAIQILSLAKEKTKGTFTNEKISPSLNRVIFELEDLIK